MNLKEGYLNKANSLLGRLNEDVEECCSNLKHTKDDAEEEFRAAQDNPEPNGENGAEEPVDPAEEVNLDVQKLIQKHGTYDVLAGIVNVLGDSGDATDVKLGEIIQNALGPLPE